jgi:KDO2-lipid IV(A) lauroyltransferase
MSSSLAVWLFDLAARLPLSVLHWLGVGLGWVTYWVSASYAARLRNNLGYALEGCSAAEFRKTLHKSIAEGGKSLTEIAWVWRRPLQEVTGKVRECQGWNLVEAAHAKGKGVIVLTPHTGCFDVCGLYIAERLQFTALYRPPRLAWLEEVMRKGRERGMMRLARTDVGGVRLLYKALKRGEVLGLLPDQVPGKGEGEWVNFFGHPAYTMTLVGRLVQSSGATIIMTRAERLPSGTGYKLVFTPMELSLDLPFVEQMNATLESLVRTCPEQYLWSYNRYKVPAGIEAPLKI